MINNNCVYSLAQTDMTVPVRCKISTLYNKDSDFYTFSVMILSSSNTLIFILTEYRRPPINEKVNVITTFNKLKKNGSKR